MNLKNESKVVDFQHHYVPYELASRQGVSSREQIEIKEGKLPKVTLHQRVYDLELQIQEMDEAGIDVAALSCFIAWDASLEDCRVTNDNMAKAQDRYPDRFAPLAHVPAHQPDLALPELKRAISDLNLRGLALTSQIMGQALDSKEFFPMYELVCELDIPVFVHPPMTPKGYKLAEDHDLGRILAREFDLCLAATRLIAGQVLETFPTIKFVIGHFGGGIAAIKERIHKRVHRFDQPLQKSFEDYFKMLYFDTAGFEGGDLALESALRGISPDRLVFATDYPQDFTGVSTSSGGQVPTMSGYIERIKGAVSETEAENILGRTAAGLLKI